MKYSAFVLFIPSVLSQTLGIPSFTYTNDCSGGEILVSANSNIEECRSACSRTGGCVAFDLEGANPYRCRLQKSQFPREACKGGGYIMETCSWTFESIIKRTCSSWLDISLDLSGLYTESLAGTIFEPVYDENTYSSGACQSLQLRDIPDISSLDECRGYCIEDARCTAVEWSWVPSANASQCRVSYTDVQGVEKNTSQNCYKLTRDNSFRSCQDLVLSEPACGDVASYRYTDTILNTNRNVSCRCLSVSQACSISSAQTEDRTTYRFRDCDVIPTPLPTFSPVKQTAPPTMATSTAMPSSSPTLIPTSSPTKMPTHSPSSGPTPSSQPIATTPPSAQPIATTPPSAQPIATTPPSAQPIATTPPSAQPIATTPPSAQPIATTPPSSGGSTTEPPTTTTNDENSSNPPSGSQSTLDSQDGGVIKFVLPGSAVVVLCIIGIITQRRKRNIVAKRLSSDLKPLSYGKDDDENQTTDLERGDKKKPGREQRRKPKTKATSKWRNPVTSISSIPKDERISKVDKEVLFKFLCEVEPSKEKKELKKKADRLASRYSKKNLGRALKTIYNRSPDMTSIATD